MTLQVRFLCLLGCLAAPACFGGPTSDWPTSSNGDQGESSPTTKDAGKKPTSTLLDAATRAPISDESSSCDDDLDAGAATDAGAEPSSDAGVPDAACR